METAQIYDLAIAWNWEFDHGFIDHVHEVACQNDIKVLEIRNEKVEEIFQSRKIINAVLELEV